MGENRAALADVIEGTNEYEIPKPVRNVSVPKSLTKMSHKDSNLSSKVFKKSTLSIPHRYITAKKTIKLNDSV